MARRMRRECDFSRSVPRRPGRGAGHDGGRVRDEGPRLDRGAGVGHQLLQVGEVVDAEEADGSQLLCTGEVAEVVAIVVLAGRAWAARAT